MDENKFSKDELVHLILRRLKIPCEFFVTGDTVFDSITHSIKKFIMQNIDRFDMENPTIEGESKRIYRWNDLALVELKATMYSFTFNRYGVVEGTDHLRLDFWRLFGSRINTISSDYFVGMIDDEFCKELSGLVSSHKLSIDLPFLSNYLGELSVGKRRFAVIFFEDEIPPLEVVWKDYLVGTMKHALKNVDSRSTKSGDFIPYESKFPKSIVRFDWRNPLPDKDECIPDEFADFFIDTQSARHVARLVSAIIQSVLREAGYQLVDLCYFMNYEGSRICSEITPDGMRIRKKTESFDKDLWRMGKDKDTIRCIWNGLYKDLVRDRDETCIA